jgi:hypothetical protein
VAPGVDVLFSRKLHDAPVEATDRTSHPAVPLVGFAVLDHSDERGFAVG